MGRDRAADLRTMQMSVSINMLVCMRTTLNLPDGLVEEVKRRATEQQRTFTSLVEQGLRLVLREPDAGAASAPPLPTHGDPHGRILVDVADRDHLWMVLDETDDA